MPDLSSADIGRIVSSMYRPALEDQLKRELFFTPQRPITPRGPVGCRTWLKGRVKQIIGAGVVAVDRRLHNYFHEYLDPDYLDYLNASDWDD